MPLHQLMRQEAGGGRSTRLMRQQAIAMTTRKNCSRPKTQTSKEAPPPPPLLLVVVLVVAMLKAVDPWAHKSRHQYAGHDNTRTPKKTGLGLVHEQGPAD